MLDSIIKALEFLLKAFQQRTDQKRRKFDQVYKPLFDLLQEINKNYHDMFEELSTTLRLEPGQSHPESENLCEAAQKLQSLRTQFSPVRAQCRGMAKSLSTLDLPVIEKEFVTAVLEYFPRGELVIEASGKGDINTSSSIVLKKIYEELARGETPSSEIPALVAGTINVHLLRWEKVCAAYEKLKFVVST